MQDSPELGTSFVYGSLLLMPGVFVVQCRTIVKLLGCTEYREHFGLSVINIHYREAFLTVDTTIQ